MVHETVWSLEPGILVADETDGTPGGDEHDRANARLIATAPELYEALEDVTALYASVADRVLGLSDAELSDHLRKADAALARARGDAA